MNDIAFVTRFHYPENHPDWEFRFEYYANEVLPRVLKQTDQNFDIWLWVEPHHEDLVKSLSPRIQTFWAPYTPKGERFVGDHNPYEQIVGLPKYRTQIGLDSDELVSRDFVAKVRELCVGDQSTLVSFQPVLFDLKTRKQYSMRRRYDEKNGSAIFALYQPDFTNYKVSIHQSHRRMPRLFDRTIFVPEGYVLVTVHGHNDSTTARHGKKPYSGRAITKLPRLKEARRGQPNHR